MAVITSLVSYYSLGEASGDATDSHRSNTLTDNNGVGTGTGKVGNARDFERSSSQWLSRADNIDFSMGDVDFSIAAWVNLESKPGNMAIVQKLGNSNGEYSLFYGAAADTFRLSVWGSASYGNESDTPFANFSAPSLGTWYFVVCWHDSVNNEIGVQVNNGTPDTTSHTTGVYDGTDDFTISTNKNGDYFDGLIDEVGIWKKVLTADERTWLYNSGNGRSYADIVAEAGTGTPFFSRIGAQRL